VLVAHSGVAVANRYNQADILLMMLPHSHRARLVLFLRAWALSFPITIYYNGSEKNVVEELRLSMLIEEQEKY